MNNYVSAGEMPWKLVKKFPVCKPWHLQFIPTNKCNANCPWCSCRNEDRSLELSIDVIENIAKWFSEVHNTTAVTITGGGEPTIHPEFSRILKAFALNDIAIGLVTNGIKFMEGDIDIDLVNHTITWIRFSIYNTQQYPINKLRYALGKLSCDVGISFTVTPEANLELVEELNNIGTVTHIRYVSDICNLTPGTIQKLHDIKMLNSPKAIIQDRSVFTRGSITCRLPQVKPLLAADGWIYPCCGVQYAADDENRMMPKRFRICEWREYTGDEVFDGSICNKCYYSQYNMVLQQLYHRETVHEDFI